jgi:CheY-like chemotaxis protein/signal transduction histidine kinase
MKKFYVIFFSGCVLFSVLLYFPIGWFLGGLAVTVIAICYQFYLVKLKQSYEVNKVLKQQMDDLQVQLDNSIVKGERAIREADQVRQLKQDLLKIISHEIRTPMNGIIGMNSLLAGTILTSEQKEYSDTIQRCGESLVTTVNDILVNDLLHYSKLQQEGTQLEYKDFELRDCVEEVLEMFAGNNGNPMVDLVYEIDDKVPAQIIGDSRRLRQVLMNLVENAVRNTSRGEVFIHVRLLNQTMGSPPEIEFLVKDSGFGIAVDQLKNLLKGIPPKEGSKGTEKDARGLGLVICKKIVEMMGGTINAESELGKGSTFSFRIHVIPGVKTTRYLSPDNMENLEAKQVLLVDDNATSRTVLSRQLQSWKMVAVSANGGADALKSLLENKRIDIVVIDRYMQEMDGIQLARSIKDKFPDIPLLLMNSGAADIDKNDIHLFAAIITKPVRRLIWRDHLLALFTKANNGEPAITKNLSEDFSKQYPLRILVAEDNHINQKIAVKVLGKLGYHPALANNGKEVLEMIGQDYYDVILMDIQMPEMDGLEATRMIRTCLEVQPVIIAMTANVMQGDRDQCMQAGMDDYLSKPIDMKELLNQLEKWGLTIINRKKLSA